MRWENLKVEGPEEQAALPGHKDPATIRRFDAPEAMDMRFYEIRAKSALNRVPKASRMPFRWTINPFRGCSHSCRFCYARDTHKFLDFDAGRDFEREIIVKINVPELVRAELNRPSWKGEHVALGTNTDPYQWVESKYELMPGIWEAMRDARNPCSLLTRSPLVLRDIELLKELREVTDFRVNLSLPTLDVKAWRATEPHSPHPRKRIEAIATLNAAGIPTGALVAPLMPGINDAPELIEELLEALTDAGAVGVGGHALYLRGEVKELWFEWLRDERPDLLPLYEELYGEGAYAPPAERARLANLLRQAGAPPATRFEEQFPARERSHKKVVSREKAQASLF